MKLKLIIALLLISGYAFAYEITIIGATSDSIYNTFEGSVIGNDDNMFLSIGSKSLPIVVKSFNSSGNQLTIEGVTGSDNINVVINYLETNICTLWFQRDSVVTKFLGLIKF